MKRLLLTGPAALVAVVAAALAGFSRLESFDLLFDLATGRWILAHGFPQTDPFSLTATSHWFHHEWLSCVGFELAARLWGGFGPALAMGLVISLGVLLLGRLVVEAAGRWGALALVAFLLALVPQMPDWPVERAFHVGNALFLAALWLLQRARAGRPWAAWAFVPLCALWANAHGSWIAAPALLLAAACGRLLEKRSLRAVPWSWVAVAALCLGVAGLSPEGWANVAYPLRFLWAGHGRGDVAEWRPLDPFGPAGLALLALLLLTGLGLRRATSRPWSLVVPALGLVVVAGFIDRFAQVAAPLLALVVLEAWKTAAPAAQPTGAPAGVLARWGAAAGGALWPALLLCAVAVWAWIRPASLRDRLDPDWFPIRSLERLAALPPGRVLNAYHLGGAISAIAGPGHKVFIDGRYDPFPPAVHAAYERLVFADPGWEDDLHAYAPDYILWAVQPVGQALSDKLAADPAWRRVEREPAGELWLPAGQPAQPEPTP